MASRSSLFPCSGGIAYLKEGREEGRKEGEIYYMLHEFAGQAFIMHKDLIKAKSISLSKKSRLGPRSKFK